MKTGVANLPLHYGKAPRWLFERMTKLARGICTIIVKEKGSDYLLGRLSDPFWFQSFGCVLGFDWHSSGLTTTVCGAIKEALAGSKADVGIFVCGGKGAASRKTPSEIEQSVSRYRISAKAENLIYASKMSAKVDNTALQDGFQLYHHCFIFTLGGSWVVIQQGMNQENHWARRYHWHSASVADFVCEPHSAICCDHSVDTLNMVAKESSETREISCVIANSSTHKVLGEFKKIRELNLPQRHPVVSADIKPGNLEKVLLKTYERHPANFEELLTIEGVGPKTIRALALIAELVYGARPSYEDPAKFSFAHGGKDGYPYHINRRDYDTSIDVLRQAISDAKIGSYDKMRAIKRLQESISV